MKHYNEREDISEELARRDLMIDQLQAEVERLREDNQLLRRQNGSLTQQVIDRGQERDHLEERLAHCQRLLASGVLYKYDELLRRDAEVFERAAGMVYKVFNDAQFVDGLCLDAMQALEDYAIQLRQQAKELQS